MGPMTRLPFDPDKASGPPSPRKKKPARREARTLKALADAERLTVSQLAELIKTTLEQRIASPIRVVGEVSNFSAKNHWYFSLKDDAAVVSCVAWASSARKFGVTPKDGDEVLATGHVSHYPPQGRTQLYVSNLRPVGAGALEQKFRAMCEQLRALGYFDEARKKPVPVFPRRIAVITSASGAAVQDVISTAAQRCRAVGLVIVDVLVQGADAAPDIAGAIRHVDRHHRRLGVEAILVTRGGGSMEDLWAFNERIVADAAFACSIPLVAAIGHESDTTVIELVADIRAATPTQAAMRLVPADDDLTRQLDHLHHRLLLLTRRRVEQARERLTSLARHELFRTPALLVARSAERVNTLDHRLAGAARLRLAHDRARFERLVGRFERLRPATLIARRHEQLAVLTHRLRAAARRRVDQRPALDHLHHRLHRAAGLHFHQRVRLVDSIDRELAAVDPRRVLQRGYSLTIDAAGNVIRSIRDVRGGDVMQTHVADGSIHSVVGRTGPRRSAGSSPRQSRRSPSPDEREQMDLFDGSG